MKLFIASDIHGSAKYCQLMLEAFLKEGADKLLLLGDILYHGPRNPLPEEYSPKYVAEMLAAVRRDVICVRGNCDSEVDQMVLPFPILSEYAAVLADGVNIYLSHGHKRTPPLNKGDVYVTGHTHVPMIAEENGFYHLNPGSVSLPKEGTNRGYILYENGVFSFKTLGGEKYDELIISGADSETAQTAPVEETKPVEVPVVAPVPQPVDAPITQPASQTVNATIPQPVPQPVNAPITQPAPQPVPKPVPQPVFQPEKIMTDENEEQAVEQASADEKDEPAVSIKRPILRRKIVRRRR